MLNLALLVVSNGIFGTAFLAGLYVISQTRDADTNSQAVCYGLGVLTAMASLVMLCILNFPAAN